MKTCHYFDLGASLYIPADHSKLIPFALKPPTWLRSLIICLEDALSSENLHLGRHQLKQVLARLTEQNRLHYFIRPRHAEMMADLLDDPHIHKISGFVLPKFDLQTLPEYQRYASADFHYMPILETAQVFDVFALAELKQALLDWSVSIPCLRIGGNDLLNLLGIKRMPGLTLYDTPLRQVVDQLIIHWRPAGFELSAPVFDWIDDHQTLRREFERDLAYGFYAKTAIHPQQALLIEQMLSQFSQSHQQQAQSVLAAKSPAVFKYQGQMMEKNCHRQWADRTLQLARAVKPFVSD